MIQQLALAIFFGALCSSVEAKAEFSIHCPQEGLFSAPLELGDMPNPSAGWDLFLEEASPQKIELSPPPRGEDGFWLITCHVTVRGGGSIELSSHINGTRVCSLSANGGVIAALPNGGQSCLFEKSGKAELSHNSCSVNCR
jgi:hypothetical protein